MIVDLKNTITSLRPIDVSMYLRSKGWKRSFSFENNYGSVWNFVNPQGEEIEILLPEDQTLLDYKTRMLELFNTIELVENRPATSIVNDISNSGADVLRFRIASSETYTGTIPITLASSLSKGVETLLLAAACATISPKSYFPRMSYVEAKEYLQNCKMGQSEKGSYVVTVLSPVSPALLTQKSLFPDYEADESYERKVLYTLFNGLHHLKNALLEGTGEAIEQTISSGVSANLCEALTLMQPNNDIGELEIGVSWSPVRPIKRNVPQQKVKFTKDIFPLLSESVKFLRQTAPIEGYELRGLVRRLDSVDPTMGGKISVVALMDNKPVSVSFELPSQTYQVAVKAHSSGSMLFCKGTLEKEGKGYKLYNISDVRIETDLEES